MTISVLERRSSKGRESSPVGVLAGLPEPGGMMMKRKNMVPAGLIATSLPIALQERGEPKLDMHKSWANEHVPLYATVFLIDMGCIGRCRNEKVQARCRFFKFPKGPPFLKPYEFSHADVIRFKPQRSARTFFSTFEMTG